MAKGHKDKVAVITGGANGIGQAFAQRLAEDGVDVAVVDVVSGAATVKLVEAAGRREQVERLQREMGLIGPMRVIAVISGDDADAAEQHHAPEAELVGEAKAAVAQRQPRARRRDDGGENEKRNIGPIQRPFGRLTSDGQFHALMVTTAGHGTVSVHFQAKASRNASRHFSQRGQAGGSYGFSRQSRRGQPRRLATRRKRGSGRTANGFPTRSSMGISVELSL